MEFDLERYQPLPVRYELRYMMLKKIQEGSDPLPDIYGREETKEDVIRSVLSCSHPYLVSREGTGKTRLAESLVKLLPPVPKVKGCPYNCDPKWPREWLCPRCLESENLVEEFGVEFIVGKERYSRIQGNEYTNEAKILGVKDIQAIVQGGSPTDPKVFMGTGILRGNRGIVCVDELPAIPTKVQVLLHPLLQEGKIILEEYNWERPVDIFFIATGNPTGFAHVNRIPEPLLDRLELIHMRLPEEKVERDIMFKEKFRVYNDFFREREERVVKIRMNIMPSALKRSVRVPWWTVDVINKTSRYSRDCPHIDRGASIRGSIKALDHTSSSTEMRNGNVANLADVALGLKLALRGRIRLRTDLIGFDEHSSSLISKHNLVVEDIMWHAVRDVGTIILLSLGNDFDRGSLKSEIENLLTIDDRISNNLHEHPLICEAIQWMEEISLQREPNGSEVLGDLLRTVPAGEVLEIQEEYLFSAVEVLANTLLDADVTDISIDYERIFVPKRMKV